MVLKILTFYEGAKSRSLVVATALLAVMVAMMLSSSAGAQDKTVVTIHESQNKRSFVTDATTVGGVLERAQIDVGEKDLIEPGLNEAVGGDSFTINIYRSRLITVVDGENEIIVSTAHRSPEAIAQTAGLTVYPEDEYEFTRSEDFINQTIGQRMTIDRADPIELVLFGTIAKVRTQTTTVGDFLVEKNIVLGEGEVVEPVADTAITSGMRLVVAKVGTEVVAEKEVVAYGREVINDPNAPIGSERIQTPGVEGEALVTYEITYRDGNETGRKVLQEVVLTEPKDEVVIIGSQAVDISGDKLDWMLQAGIPQSDWPYVDSIISKESRWNYLVWNGLGSGAYGLCQSLPATKMATAGGDYMTNPITQLRWCDGYAKARYGSWAGAFEFWQNNYWW